MLPWGMCGWILGVASGDATFQSVVLWSRITAQDEEGTTGQAKVDVSICEEKSNLFTVGAPGCKNYKVLTSSQVDFNVKVEATGLVENRDYFYQFQIGQELSPVGHTKTIAKKSTNLEELNYALFSCSHFTFGYFHAYELAAYSDNLDFWLHVGDFIYEYGDDDSFNGDARGIGEMGGETITLQDYRRRHKKQRTDAGLQLLQRRAPMYVIWDDHEVTNDGRSDGAENHDAEEGDYNARVLAGLRAYHEWMPIKSKGCLNDLDALKDISVERHFGNLMSLAAYDTRFRTRTLSDNTDYLTLSDPPHAVLAKVFQLLNNEIDPATWTESPYLEQLQAAAESVAGDFDPTAELLGADRRKSLKRHFKQSVENGAPWQVFATSVPMSERFLADFWGVQETLLDSLSHLPDVDAQTILQTYVQVLKVAFADVRFILAQLSATFKIPYNSDMWDGFPVEREKVLQIFKEFTNNAVVVSGDSHNAHLTLLKTKEDGTPVALEFDGPSVTSQGIESVTSPVTAMIAQFTQRPGLGFDIIEDAVMRANPDTYKYTNIKDRGFVKFKVTPESMRGEYVFMNTDRFSGEISNENLLADPNFQLKYYCDAKATHTAGTSPADVLVDHTIYGSAATSCDSNFSRENFDTIFA